ncbi:MAG: FeoB-associated Cys-rich membrane protein [Phycisphaerae bacterium]|nr:FeoB-associated Cys-rich membrane protein [Phycisphaerae bacterium]
MDITAVSKTHEIVVIAILVAAAIFLLIRQFYRMAKGKDSGCASCSKSCSLKNSDSQCPSDDINASKDESENNKG